MRKLLGDLANALQIIGFDWKRDPVIGSIVGVVLAAIRTMETISPTQVILTFVYATAGMLLLLAVWRVLRRKFKWRTGSAETVTPAQPLSQTMPPQQTGGVGIIVSGGVADSNLVMGFETGIVSEGGRTTNNVAIRESMSAHVLPASTGEFATISSQELKERTKQLAAELIEFDVRFENAGDFYKARDAEFKANYMPLAISLASEILNRTGPIQLPRMSPVWFGSQVLSLQMPAGAEPIRFTSYFLDYISDKLET